ncbi:MAG: hypothetical protein WCD18_03990, partial [Thermosynechococcaceae cyanobacterium]
MDDFDKAIAQVFDWVGEWVYQGCEAVFEELEAVALELEAAADICLEPIFSWLDEAEEAIGSASHPLTQTVAPVLQEHPACVGCCHYHGETYGGHT